MNTKNTGIIYSLEDRPPFLKALLGGIQHVLASFVGVITPTLIIGGVLGLGSEIPYLISMALIVSGVATFIQARRIGPIGSGLLSVQGTSFAFLGSVLACRLFLDLLPKVSIQQEEVLMKYSRSVFKRVQG